MDDVSDTPKGGFFLCMLPVILAWIGAIAFGVFAFYYIFPTSHAAKHSVSSPVATSRTYSPSPQIDNAILAKALMGHRPK
ncbi:hypothetical protein HER14_09815 [Acidithiobacillus thiooxidans]|uniref:hypothetical protein n=1 Tax=Acidithiobacillus thiooxidans TaxID=930 RepID=UPI001C069134|nr:hypothetical protein [Acidithiobacillus thiooxidans]MBU2751222.1 hypothetical protein [Acidithiobacillus thiooxidans]